MSECREFEGIVRSLDLAERGLELTLNTSKGQEKVVLSVTGVSSEFDLIPYQMALKGNRVVAKMFDDSVYVSELAVLSGRLRDTRYTARRYD